MIEIIEQINSQINSFVWGPVMLALMGGVGIYFTLRTRFFQIGRAKDVTKNTLGSLKRKKVKRDKNSISPFQAMTTALAGTLGTGNIIGVATAIVAGGPGAVFWMWVSAFFGMMTKYAEVLLSIKYREKSKEGFYVGGPMYYIQNGLNKKWLAVLFSITCILASFGIGNLTQTNSISAAMQNTFSVPPIVSGIVCAIVIAIIIIGGVKRIAQMTEKIVPFMGILYVIGAIVAVAMSYKAIPEAFSLIFRYAFNLRAAAGGASGYVLARAFHYGFSRGVFSNEAGLGSAPIAHAAADTDSPVKQGMWGIFEVFADTIVMCTLTTLVILTSGLWDSGLNGIALTSAAFYRCFGDGSVYFIAISTVFFAVASIVCWSYYGERCIEYVFKGRRAIMIYRVLFVALVIVGATTGLNLVWEISDTLNGIMAIPNIIALIALSPVVIKLTKEYAGKKHP